MKARRKDTNDEWKEVKYIQLEDSDILYKQEYLEFDAINKTPEQIADEVHWQGIRERAAIAAMQGMLSNPQLRDTSYLDYRFTIGKAAIDYADELVKKIKRTQQ